MNRKQLAKSTAAVFSAILMATTGVASLPVNAATATSQSVGAVLDYNAVTFKPAGSYEITPGQSVKANVTVDKTKAKGTCTFEFGYKTSDYDSFKSLKTVKSSAKSLSYTYTCFSYVSNYVAVVKVTDSTGATRNFTFTVNSHYPLDGTFTTTAPSKLGVNSEYETHIYVTGGIYQSVYHYKWGYYFNGKKQSPVASKNCTGMNFGYTYKFTKVGEYIPYVEVRDGRSNEIIRKLPKVTVTSFEANFGKLSPSYTNCIKPGQAFVATANVGGGKAPYTYKFYYNYRGQELKYAGEIKNTKSPQVTYTYNFTNPNGYLNPYYTPVIKVTDANGVTSIKSLSDVYEIDYKIAFKANTSKTIKKSQTFKTTTTVTNGKSNYTYKYYYKLNGKAVTVPITSPETT